MRIDNFIVKPATYESSETENFDYEGGSNIVEVYIKFLRKKVDNDFSPKLIHTIRRVGYILKVENE